MSAMLCAAIKILAWSFLRKVSGLREIIQDGGWDGFIPLHVPGLQRPGKSLVQMPALGVAVKTATWSLDILRMTCKYFLTYLLFSE